MDTVLRALDVLVAHGGTSTAESFGRGFWPHAENWSCPDFVDTNDGPR